MDDSDSLSFNQIQDSSDDLGALEDTDVCVVCCESLEDSLLLNCLHSICKSCATSQTTEQIRCPRCRATSSCRQLTKDFLHSSDPPKPLQWEDQNLISEINSLLNDGRTRTQVCNEDVNQLNNNLEAIHEDRVKIKAKIDETFELYKSILEDIRGEFLLQLENCHNDKELVTMDRIQDLELGKGNLDHTMGYVNKIIKDFPNTEALNVLPMARDQLIKNLRHLEGLCKAEKPSSLHWTPHPKQFRKCARENFGSFTEGGSPPFHTSHSLVIPEIAQRDVIHDGDEDRYSKAITNMPREKKMSTCSDLLSPMVPDQGFVSPGEHLLSPLPPCEGGMGSSRLHSPMGSELFVNPPSLQVPQFINSGMMMQQSRPALPPRPDTGGSTRSGSQLLTGPDTSPAHLGYPGRRMGTSHPDLYRGHTPPPFGRGHTPPLTGGRGHTPPLGGRGITPPLLGQDMLSSQHSRTDYSLAQLAEKLERSNSGPTPGITLADLFHASEGQTKDWEDPVNANNPTSQAFTNIAALAQLDEMQEKKVSGGWDHNLLMPEMDRSRSHSALGNSGQLSPVPVPPLSPLLGVPGSHMDPRGASPISPIDSLMPCMSGMSLSPVPPFRPSRSINSMQVRCKFGTLGPGQFQFNAPHGFCLGIDEEIVVADTHNHRIVIYEKNGMYKNKFGVAGKDEGQLWYPRKVAVIKSSGKFVICDRGNERSRMQIFTKHGHWVRKIAIRYIDIVAGLAITRNEDIVAVDSVTPTIFVISESGKLVRWFDCADHMREPSDIAVSGSEFFVCDFKGHNVVVFSEDGKFLRRIGYEKITNFPNGIDVSDHGDVLIGDSHGNRFHVAVFGSDGNLLAEFECPYVKVSRCCGLKLTSEGYVVTLAKNNHHVLVLNTLYIN